MPERREDRDEAEDKLSRVTTALLLRWTIELLATLSSSSSSTILSFLLREEEEEPAPPSLPSLT